MDIVSKICPRQELGECRQWVEEIKKSQGLPTDFVEEILSGRQGLLGRCGGYTSGYSKDSQVVSGCLMGHLRAPSTQFVPALFLWANGLPNGARPRSLLEAFYLRRSTIPSPPSLPAVSPDSAVRQTGPATISVQKLLEIDLQDWPLHFTHENEWRVVEKEMRFLVDGSFYWETIRWYYRLTPNADGTYKLSWSYLLPMADPKPSDPSLNLTVDEKGEYPPNLSLTIFGKAESDQIIITDLQLTN